MAQLISHGQPVDVSIGVVDDDPSVLKSLSRLLRASGYTVHAFASPQECLAAFESSPSSCYVIDVQMPVMDGFELLGCLRQQGCQSPVFFITAHDSTRTRALAMRSGSIGLFLKPFDDTALLAAVSESLRNLEALHTNPAVAEQ